MQLRLLALAAGLVALPAVLPAATIVTDQSVFASDLASGYYLENFDSYLSGYQGTSITHSGGSYSYTASVSYGQLWVSISGADQHLATNDPRRAITFTFGSGVTAVGASVAITNLGNDIRGGTVTLNLNDGTTQTATITNTAAFVGFLSTTPITSLTITPSPSGSGLRYLSVDDLYVGAVKAAVPPAPVTHTPEPTSIGLAAAGCGALALLRKRFAA